MKTWAKGLPFASSSLQPVISSAALFKAIILPAWSVVTTPSPMERRVVQAVLFPGIVLLCAFSVGDVENYGKKQILLVICYMTGINVNQPDFPVLQTMRENKIPLLFL